MTTAEQPRLTKTQRDRLNWLAENPANNYLVSYGKQVKTALALQTVGYVERDPQNFGRFIITEAGAEAIR